MLRQGRCGGGGWISHRGDYGGAYEVYLRPIRSVVSIRGHETNI